MLLLVCVICFFAYPAMRLRVRSAHEVRSALQCVEFCCSVLQCVAVSCSVLRCVAVCCSVLRCVGVEDTVCSSVLQRNAVTCCGLQ